MTPQEALDKAISIIGSMQTLADQMDPPVTKGAVGQWKLPGRQIPAEHCPTIERLTNREVKCEELRPDMDWAFIRNSPEGDEGASIPNRRATDKEPTP